LREDGVALFASSLPEIQQPLPPSSAREYIAHAPLTREQFRAALAKGFKLVSYSYGEDGDVVKEWEH